MFRWFEKIVLWFDFHSFLLLLLLQNELNSVPVNQWKWTHSIDFGRFSYVKISIVECTMNSDNILLTMPKPAIGKTSRISYSFEKKTLFIVVMVLNVCFDFIPMVSNDIFVKKYSKIFNVKHFVIMKQVRTRWKQRTIENISSVV